MSAPRRYCGRELSQADLAVLRGLAATLPTRTAIAAAACEALGLSLIHI